MLPTFRPTLQKDKRASYSIRVATFFPRSIAVLTLPALGYAIENSIRAHHRKKHNDRQQQLQQWRQHQGRNNQEIPSTMVPTS